MSDVWLEQKLAECGTEDGSHPEEVQALQAYLSGQRTPSQAAEAITRPMARSLDPNDDLPRLYSLLVDALIELPLSELPSLVALLGAIEDLPPLGVLGLPLSSRPAHGQLWRGLPGFGHHWADMYPSLRQWIDHGGFYDTSATAADQNEAAVASSVRRAEAEARLALGHVARIPIDWGYECVADVLENNTATAAVAYATLPAACKWLEIAGDRFRDGAAAGEKSWGLKKKNDLWDGEATDGKMDLDRWELWHRRLKEFESDENSPASVGSAVRGCIDTFNQPDGREV